MVGVWLIATLIVMGGAIAYLGNRIGRSIGRRRFSLLGLRPKYSSVIMTILTGIMIATVSLTVLAVASADVRTALFQMQEIKASLAQTEAAAAEMLLSRDAALAETMRLREESQALLDALKAAQDELEASKSQIASLKNLAATLEDNVRKMQETERQLRQDVAALSEQFIATEGALRSGSFVYLKDEIVTSRVIAGNPDRAQNEDALRQLLEEADRKAHERGVRIPGTGRAIQLGSEATFLQVVDLLTHDAGEWVVRVTAGQNTVQGEPLLVYLHLFPRRRIYRAGEIIAQGSVDRNDRDLEAKILRLLDEVNRDALQKGMITDENGNVGQMDGEIFVDAVLKLRRLSGPAQVQVVAAKDTWNTEGPLMIDVQVR